jgi:hypothetical protein
MFNLFSQRQGITKDEEIKKDELPIEVRRRLWNEVKNYIDNQFGRNERNKTIEYLWDRFFKEDLDTLRTRQNFDTYFCYIDQVKTKFFRVEWYGVYDFLEFLLAVDNSNKIRFINNINQIFVDERMPYKVIDNCVTPLISGEEAEEVKIAIDSKYSGVSKHIKNSLEFYKKRPVADYKNSIKESISAIESLARTVLNKPSGTLGSLSQSLNIHPAFKKAIKELYGWTSDEGGVRHSENGKGLKIDESEARFMLVECSALVNYIISKYEK